MFFVNDGVTPIPFSDGILLALIFMFFVDPNGIFFDVWQISLELQGESYCAKWIIFVDFDLFRSYFALGSWSFKQFKFFGNLIVFSKFSFSYPSSPI